LATDKHRLPYIPSPLSGGRLGWGGDIKIIMNIMKARELRKNPTDAERKLWSHLRRRQIGGHKFRRQLPLGPYFVDFVCLEKKLVVEVDGGQHNEQGDYDVKRTEWLEAQRFRVLRFWNNEVLKEIEIVKEVIEEALGDGDNTPLL